MNRTWIVWTCLFFIVLNAQYAAATDLGEALKAGKIQGHEKRMGPFEIDGKGFSVILKVLTYPGASIGFAETVESFSIVDKEGAVHYQQSFGVEYGNTGFTESSGVSAYVLDSRGKRGFRYESGELKEMAPEDRPGAGLVLYYGFVPSAPSSGASCQVFALKKDHLVPLFSPLTVNGEIHELMPGSHPNARRLFDGDTMRFGVHTRWFEVVVPLRVFDNLSVLPLHHHMTFNYYAFDVIAKRMPSEEDTFVRFFNIPDAASMPRHVIIKKETQVTFLLAYTRVSIESRAAGCVLSVDEMPWLKVRIDGKEGFVKDAEDLFALGLREAG